MSNGSTLLYLPGFMRKDPPSIQSSLFFTPRRAEQLCATDPNNRNRKERL